VPHLLVRSNAHFTSSMQYRGAPNMTSSDKLARFAGLFYLILLPTTGLWYGAWRFTMAADAASTLAKIQTSRTLLELAIIAGGVGFVDFLIVGLVFYRLFTPVGRDAATLMLAFVATSVPLSLAAVARHIDVLSLLDAAKGLPALTGEPLQVQVMLTLHSANNLFLITTIFSGVWLIPLGWLVFRCGFMPRALGVLLMLGSVFYVLTFAGTVFNPDYANTLFGGIVGISSGIPGILGELGTGLWLLIKGARYRKTAVHPTAV
jgi:Domain of unknown function (DUF4386)